MMLSSTHRRYVSTWIGVSLSVGGCLPQPPEPATNAQTAPPVFGVRSLLESPPAAGTILGVTGLCYGLAGTLAAGPPPRSRSDWQLGNDTIALYVVGAIPSECVQASEPPLITITAVVERDSIATTLGGPRSERVYLRRP
jgi:hypothetical protein